VDDLARRVANLERRLEDLERGRSADPAADLFERVAGPEPEARAGRTFDRRRDGSVGCQNLKRCTHAPCLCRAAWSIK
jgi:hypothetical protein